MSTPTFTAQLGLPDPSANPLTVTELVVLLNALFLPVSVGNYNAQIVTGSSTPAVGDQDKLWFRSDVSGNPLGFYAFIGGNWRPVYTGRLGEITMFANVPTGLFDSTGLAVIGSVWDGWAICNGNNGTVDLRNKFIIAAQESASGSWVTGIESGVLQNTGGDPSHSITPANLPPYDPVFRGAEYDPNSSQATNNFIIDNHWLNYGQGTRAPNAGDVQYGSVGQTYTPLPIIPPYVAVAYLQFIGY